MDLNQITEKIFPAWYKMMWCNHTYRHSERMSSRSRRYKHEYDIMDWHVSVMFAVTLFVPSCRQCSKFFKLDFYLFLLLVIIILAQLCLKCEKLETGKSYHSALIVITFKNYTSALLFHQFLHVSFSFRSFYNFLCCVSLYFFLFIYFCL